MWVLGGVPGKLGVAFAMRAGAIAEPKNAALTAVAGAWGIYPQFGGGGAGGSRPRAEGPAGKENC